MNDLDQAIAYHERKVKALKSAMPCDGCPIDECSEEHRQLAEWLRELKKWRALRDSINMLCDVDCEYPQYRESGTMCDACPIGTVKEYFEQIFDGKVNTDE